jgi:hypothetical protein
VVSIASLVGGALPAAAAEKDASARYASDERDWLPDTLQWDAWPVDLRHLNASDRPAGRHGPVRAEGDRLVFQDGTEARFWGTNIQAFALFSTNREAIRQQARRLAAFGYNLVRFHHHDSHWVVPNVFDESDGSTRRLRPASLESIDWWVKCLNDEGIYVWLDLHVGRRLLPGDGRAGVKGLSEMTGADLDKGFVFVNPDLERLSEEFAAAYLVRKNKFTGQRYVDNPALLGVLVTNENDLNTHFAARMFPKARHSVHRALYETAVDRIKARLGLPSVRAADTWAGGPGKLVLATLEAEYFQRATAHLRGLGLKVLIAPGNYWGEQPWHALPSLALGDVIDAHSYGQVEHLGTDPRVEPNYLVWVAGAQVAGKPLTISEWSIEMDRRDRFTAPVLFAAVASLQGWDAPMHFTYQQQPVEPPTRAQMGSNSYDPGLMVMMPAAAVLFRERHVRQATRTFHVQLTPDDVYLHKRTPAASMAIRTLTEQSRVAVTLPDTKELPWDASPPTPPRKQQSEPKPVLVTDLNQDFLPPGQNFVRSDTGELTRDWGAGYHTVDTSRTQATAGWMGGRTVKLGDVEIRVRTPKAAVAVTSLDGNPIARSARLLVSAVAQVKTRSGDKLPFYAEPVRGQICLRTRANAGRLWATPLLPSGTQGQTIPIPMAAGRHCFELPPLGPHWFLLQPKAGARPGAVGARP